MADALVQGKRIEIRGFGSFDLHCRPPRIARNPKTGEAINLPAKVVVHFKPGKEMRDRVNAARENYGITEWTARRLFKEADRESRHWQESDAGILTPPGCWKKDVQLADIRALLGHEIIATTQIYTYAG